MAILVSPDVPAIQLDSVALDLLQILIVFLNSGRIARRNRVHLKNDQTPAYSEPGPQKPLQRNSELGPQKPLQRNSELGPQKPLQRNSEPVTQKPICELLPPQPEADTSDSSVVEEQALTGPDVINIPDPHVLRRSSRVDRRKPSRFKDYERLFKLCVHCEH